MDGNGTLEFAEFVILMTSKMRVTSLEEEISDAFDVLDRAKDKHIRASDLKYYMRKVARIQLSSEEAEAMIEFADTDEDGLVTFDDFREKVMEALDAAADFHKGEENNDSDQSEEDSDYL